MPAHRRHTTGPTFEQHARAALGNGGNNTRCRMPRYPQGGRHRLLQAGGGAIIERVIPTDRRVRALLGEMNG